MYIFKDALRSIGRSRGRNILIGIIIFVIAVSSCVALSIGEAAGQAKENGMEQLEITAQIMMNRQAMMSGQEDRESMRDALMNMEELSLEEMQQYAKSDDVKSFYYTISASLNAGEGLEAVDVSGNSDSEEDTSQESGQAEQSARTQAEAQGAAPAQEPGFDNNGNMQDAAAGGPDEGMRGGRMGMQGDFTVTGYSSDEAMKDFLNGNSSISEGSMFDENDQENQCIISSELALYNDLDVGDTVTLANPNDEEETYTFTISGIYENKETSDSAGSMMGNFSPAFYAANQIYTSYENISAVAETSQAGAEVTTDENTGMEFSTAIRSQVNGTYTFASMEDYEAFKEETEEKLGEYYTVTSNDVTSYEQSLLPLENLSRYAAWFLAIVLVIGGIILAVLNIFNIRERKYEIGVLAAIGMKKWKIAAQFILELLCVTFLSVILGTGVGAVSSVPVTNQLLKRQIASVETVSEEREQNFGRMPGNGFQKDQMDGAPGMGGGPMGGFGMGGGTAAQEPGNPAANYISQVSSATNFNVVLQLIGIGILLTVVSGCVAIVFILRYDPLRILSSRD